MIQKICTLNLDMFGKYATHTDYVLVQGDIGANVFMINLQYQKLPLNLTNTITTITFRKADGNKVIGSPEIINASEGVIRYMAGEQEVAFVGEVEATVEVYDNTANRLTSGLFTFEVREQLNDGTAIESTTDYPFLADLMSAGASELERVNAEDARTDSELIRINNEDTRNSSEALRVSQENTRKTSETARVGAETARATAESTRNTQENTRKSNETARVSAEASRVTVETARVGAESTRASQEATRVTQETGRTGAESIRVTQENTRQTNESTRGTAETSRSTAETARQTAETDRVSKESTRVSTEAVRSSSEATRVSQENTRVTQETARVNAEGDATKGRVKAENLRVTAESGRVTAETGRTTAEGTRVSSETSRGTSEATRVTQETARVNAEGDATKGRVKAENLRVTAETGRVSSESTRVTQETGRVNAEGSRVTAETARGSAETTRLSNETARVSSESTRATNETARSTAETTRNTQENTRIANETARGTAETSRATAETNRVSVEGSRVTAETARANAEASRASVESARVTAETARGTAEGLRVSQENTRKTSETARVSAESTRVTQETARQTNTGNAITNMNNAVDSTIIIYKSPVATYSSIATTYPSPVIGWRVETTDTKLVYRYNGTSWVNIADSGIGYTPENVAKKGVANGYAPLDASSKVPLVNLPSLDYIPMAQRGAVNGVATLGADGKVPSAQLPPLDYAGSTHNHDLVYAKLTQVLTNVPAGAIFTDTVYTHPATHPATMITGLPTSLPANGGNANTAKALVGDDTRSINSEPSVYMSGGARYYGVTAWQTEFKAIATIGAGAFISGTYCYLETKTPWSDGSGGYPIQIAYGAGTPCYRVGTSATTWGAWSSYFPSDLKTKLDGIEAGANNYTHPASHPASIITQDASNRFVTDAEKTAWYAKASTIVASPSQNGLMSSTDKTKLDGIATGANNYVHPTGAGNNHIPTAGVAGQFLKWSSSGVAVWANDNDTIYTHPASHPASIITQDASNRFVTDAQVLMWNTIEEAVASFEYYRDMEAVNENMALLLPLTGGTLSGALTVAGNLTIAKSGFESLISFPAQTNDAGYISHYENANVAYMRFCVSDDATNDYFTWGSTPSAVYNEAMKLGTEGNLTVKGTITSGGTAVSLNGHTHSYAPVSHTHSYVPSTASSASWGSYDISTTKAGYSGFHFTAGDTMFMVRDTDALSGVMKSGNWTWYFDGAGALVTGTVPWARLTGVPSYAPASHSHDYVPTGGRAYPMRSDGGGLNFMWSGQGGQPPWLWGGSDGVNMYVYNPSNFNVSYANSAGNSDTVDGYHASAFVGTGGAYISHGFYLHSSPASGKYIILGNYISGSQGTEMSIVPNSGGGWCSLGISSNPFFKGYSYGWVTSSDKNLKTEIVPFSKPEGYDMLRDLKFYSYRYYKGSDEDKVAMWSHSLGVMAQDAPYEITSYAEDGTPDNGIDLYSYTSLLGIASQAMQDKIETLELKNETLQNEIEELKTVVAGILATIG